MATEGGRPTGAAMSRLLAYAQLVRLPNVPSAVADIALGAVAVGALPERWLPALALCAASVCLYMAGMALNDFFDVEEDRRERPERPIPSGRIARAEAGLLGALLLLAGVGFAAAASLTVGPRPIWTAVALVAAILAYDGGLKRTAAGPVAMGACRFLNVLLGVSVAGGAVTFGQLHLAAVVGLYIVGVTWLAKTEARTSSRAALQGAAAVILASLGLGLALPAALPAGTASPLFPFLLVGFGFFLGAALADAIRHPEPRPVQAAVKRCLVGLIVLDAILASGVAGTAGLAVLALFVPSLVLNRRRALYAT